MSGQRDYREPESDPIDVAAARQRVKSSDYRDKDVEDEHDPAVIAGRLRPDEDFALPGSTRRFPFDPDEVEAVVVHVQAGCATKATPDDVRRALSTGTTGTDSQDDVVDSVLGELAIDDLEHVIRHSGASPREVAAFFRARGGFRWPVVLCLNAMTRKGAVELPFALDKQLLAGNTDFLERW